MALPNAEHLRKVPENYQWAFMVSPVYGIVALGMVVGDQISDIRAEAERTESGAWAWHIHDSPFSGVAPSRQLAIQRAEVILGRVTVEMHYKASIFSRKQMRFVET